METRNSIYKLERIMDDPRYEGFAGKVFLLGSFASNRDGKAVKKIRMLRHWRPVEVCGRVRKYNDFPCVGLLPAFSQRAVDALRDFLEPNGELLPLASPLGSYYAYNVTKIVDALNVRRSKITWIRKPVNAFEIVRYELFAKRIAGVPIFHLPETPSQVYVSQAFVTRVQEHGLTAFDFQKVWPFPPGVDWRKLARENRDRQHAAGLPPGQTVKGNTVVIRLYLANRKSKGTAMERKAADAIMDEIDAMLVNVNAATTAPELGSLEGYDYGVPGECRLFLSCPDADALARKLRPWLRKLRWPTGLAVLKRYGNYADVEAPEKSMEI